jgi:hypothetical protein
MLRYTTSAMCSWIDRVKTTDIKFPQTQLIPFQAANPDQYIFWIKLQNIPVTQEWIFRCV